MATASENPSRRRWRQFSLRGLLGLMLLCGIGLMFWTIYIEPYRRQHQVLAAIKKAGGKVFTEAVPMKFGSWLMGDEFFMNVVEVDLMNSKVDGDWLVQLKHLPKLRILLLPVKKADDRMLAALAEMRELHSLVLFQSPITDDGLRNLKNLTKLRGVFLTECPIGDAGLAHLRGASKMEYLDLSSTHVTDEAISHLQHMPQLASVSLADTQITDRGISLLARHAALGHLNVQDTDVTEASLAQLSQLADLRQLETAGTSIIPSALREALPQLVDIHVAKKLDEPTVCPFIETPLSDVVEYLKDYHRTNIMLDARSLSAKGRRTPITCDIQAKPLKVALAQILTPLSLKAEVRYGFLMISAKDDARRYQRRLALKPGERLTRAFSHALYNPAAVMYSDTPLTKVLNDFTVTHAVPCRLDGWSPEGNEFPVTCNLYGGCAADVLELILDQLDLHGIIEGNTVLIRRGPLPGADDN